MPIEIKTPYTATPYEILSDRELGAVSANMSCREIDERWTLIVKRGRPPDAAHKAKAILRSPPLRIACDIFLSSMAQNQHVLQELADHRPAFSSSLLATPDMPPRRSLLLIDEAGVEDQPIELAARDMHLSMSTRYDEPENLLQAISFDI
jgi:hypothetical protein